MKSIRERRRSLRAAIFTAMAKIDQTPFFLALLKSERIRLPECEYKFLPDRKFRMDYAWPDDKLCLEVEGGVWVHGRHNSPQGFLADMKKYNLAAMNGWRLIRVVPEDLLKTETVKMIRTCLGA